MMGRNAMKRAGLFFIKDPKGILEGVTFGDMFYDSEKKRLGIKLRGGKLPEVPQAAPIPTVATATVKTEK